MLICLTTFKYHEYTGLRRGTCYGDRKVRHRVLILEHAVFDHCGCCSSSLSEVVCHVLVVDTEDNEWVDPSIVLMPDCEQHDFHLEVIYDMFATKRQKNNKNVHAHNIPQHTHRTRVL